MLSRQPPKKRVNVFLDSSDDEESEASYVQSNSEEESEHAAEDAMNDALSVASSASRSSDLFVVPLTQPHQRSIETPMKRPVDMPQTVKRPIDDIQPVKHFVDTQLVVKCVDTPVRVSARKIKNTSRNGSLVQDAYEIVSTAGKEKDKKSIDPTSTITSTHESSSENSLKDCAAIICGLRNSKPSQPIPLCPSSIENNLHETKSSDVSRDHHATAKSSMESLPVPEPSRKPSKLRLKIKSKKPSTSQSDQQREMLEQQSISKNQNSKAIVDAIKQKKQARSSENTQVIDLVKSPKTVAKKRVLEEWDKATSMAPTKTRVDTNTNNTKHTSAKAEVKTASPPAEIKKSAGGVKRKKRKIGKQHTAISTGSASQTKSSVNSIPASTTKNTSVAASNASSATTEPAATNQAPTKAAPNPTIIAQPKPKKKKKTKTFQQQVLLHMMTTMKPYTLKSLAVELRTTDIALRHLMLSLIDKQAVIRKEVGNKKKKELYWVDLAKATKEMYGKNVFSKEHHQATKEELRKVISEENGLLRIIKGMESDLSNDDLSKSLLEEEKTVEEMRKRVKDIKDRIALSKTPAKAKGRLAPRGGLSRFQPQPKKLKTKNQLRKDITSMRTEWKKRKEKCVDFVDQLADAMEKRPKDIHKLLDIETDEMMGVKIPPKQVD